MAKGESGVGVPDNLGIAAGALVVSLVTPIVSATLSAAAGGLFWFSVGAPICGVLAVLRALRARLGASGMGLDARHEAAERARSLAIVTMVYSAGVLAVYGVTWAAFASSAF